MPEVLKDASTEPEAAHLRGVLRRVRQMLVEGPSYQLASKLDGIIGEALDRPRTNGDVIDALTKENGDLRSEVMRADDRVRSVQRDAVATHETLRNQIDDLKTKLSAAEVSGE